MFGQLEENYSGPFGPTNCSGIQDTPDSSSPPVENERNQTSSNTTSINGQCYPRVAQQESNQTSSTIGKSVCVNTISGREGEQFRPVSPSDQSSGPEPVCRDSSAQNGEPSGGEVPDPTGRLTHEDRPERCLLYRTHSSRPLPLPSVCLPGNPVRIWLSSLWTFFSSSSIHKTLETSCCPDSLTGNPGCSLPGRHFTATPEQGRPGEDLSPGYQPTTELGIYHQAGEMLASPDTTTGIPRRATRLLTDDDFTPTTKVGYNHPRSSADVEDEQSIARETVISDWQDEPRSPDRCLEGTIVLPESSAQSIVSPSSVWQASQAIPSHLIPPEHNGAPMVVIPSNPHLQWPTLVHSSLRSDHFNRCLSGRLGSNLERRDNWGLLASPGGEIPHQLVGTQSSLPCPGSIFQLPEVQPQPHSIADGQCHCSGICEQAGGDQISHPLGSSTRLLGLSAGERFLDHSTTYSRLFEQGG